MLLSRSARQHPWENIKRKQRSFKDIGSTKTQEPFFNPQPDVWQISFKQPWRNKKRIQRSCKEIPKDLKINSNNLPKLQIQMDGFMKAWLCRGVSFFARNVFIKAKFESSWEDLLCLYGRWFRILSLSSYVGVGLVSLFVNTKLVMPRSSNYHTRINSTQVCLENEETLLDLQNNKT